MSRKDAQLQALVAPIADDLAAMRAVVAAALSRPGVPAVSGHDERTSSASAASSCRDALVLLCAHGRRLGHARSGASSR